MKPIPDEVTGLRHGSYDKLNDKGYVPEEVTVYNGDIIMAKLTPIQPVEGSNKKYKDSSVPYVSHAPGVIDKVYTNIYNNEGFEMRKMRVRSERIPQTGDKFASRHGQKGTCGILMKHSDLPYTKEGITPDIIVNPNAIPSRMTLGQIIECVLGKVVANKGTEADGTPFGGLDIESVKDELEKLGYNRNGTEEMYNGMTGQKMKMQIFIGPTYYQRLKHLVLDKIHCLTDDHEVLTLNGWKTIDNITKDTYVACLENDCLVYKQPINIYNYPNYNGDMYHIATQQVDLCVTMEHRMWVCKSYDKKIYNFELAKDIAGKPRKYKKDAKWETVDYQFILPEIEYNNGTINTPKNVDMNAWLTFFGVWNAEDWTTTYEDKRYPNSFAYRVQICQCKKRIRDIIFECIDKLGYTYSCTADKITISDKQLWTYMSEFSVGAPNKKLPDWVWKLSQKQSQLLLESMILGDGSYHKSSVRYYTSSVKLADDVMQLALHCGWSANKWLHCKAGNETKINGRTIKSKYDMWRLGIVKSKNNPEVNHAHCSTQNGQHEEIIHNYTGRVFCLEVPNGVFYVRRNGKAVWTGNSRARGPRTLLTRQAPEGRSRDGGLRLGEIKY